MTFSPRNFHKNFPKFFRNFPEIFLKLVPEKVSELVSKIFNTRSLGARWAPTSSWRPFGPAFGPSGLLDFVLRALRALRPCDPCNVALKNDRPGDDGTLRRVIFGSNVKNHRIIIIIIILHHLASSWIILDHLGSSCIILDHLASSCIILDHT